MQTKYDWSNVPKEVNWIATDFDAGYAFGYETKPEMDKVMDLWKDKSIIDYINLYIEPFQGNWKNSLEERPK